MGGVNVGAIENFNCEGKCQEECCDEKYTHFQKIKVHGMFFIILFCEKHWGEFVNKYNGAIDNLDKNGERKLNQ
jgi:hypothetical protein